MHTLERTKPQGGKTAHPRESKCSILCDGSVQPLPFLTQRKKLHHDPKLQLDRDNDRKKTYLKNCKKKKEKALKSFALTLPSPISLLK